MKLLIGVIIAAVAVIAMASTTPTKSLQSMGWIAYSSPSNGYNLPVSSEKDLFVYFEVSPTPVVSIRRRNADGIYELAANITEDAGPNLRTNGKWISIFTVGMALYSIDDNNTLSNASYVETQGGFVLSDDTFVGYDAVSELSDGNFTFRTFAYHATNNTWTSIPGTEVVTTSSVLTSGDINTYLVTDTHLVYADLTNATNVIVKIYERQADKSWKLTDTVPINSTLNLPGNLAFNGVDTIVYSLYGYIDITNYLYGIAFVYTKVNGQWTEQTFTPKSLQVKLLGYLGITIKFSDPNTLFISAPLDGFVGAVYLGGKVVMLTRSANGLWEHALDLVADNGLFGLGFAFNDHDIIVANFFYNGTATSTQFYSAPICFAQPFNATCIDQQTNDCSDLDITQLYTAYNPQCGAVSASIQGISLIDNQAVRTHITLSRGYGADYVCNATVTCPSPPVTPITPIILQTPSQVSSAGVIQLTFVSLVVSAAMLV